MTLLRRGCGGWPPENNSGSPLSETQTRVGGMAEQVKMHALQTRGPELHGSWKPRKTEGENWQLTRFTPVCLTVPNHNQRRLGNNNEESLIKQKVKKFFI